MNTYIWAINEICEFKVNSLQVATVSLMSSYVARCFENICSKYVTMYIVSRNLPTINILVILLFILIIALNNVLAKDCGLSRTGTHYKGMFLYLFLFITWASRKTRSENVITASNHHSIIWLCVTDHLHTQSKVDVYSYRILYQFLGPVLVPGSVALELT